MIFELVVLLALAAFAVGYFTVTATHSGGDSDNVTTRDKKEESSDTEDVVDGASPFVLVRDEVYVERDDTVSPHLPHGVVHATDSLVTVASDGVVRVFTRDQRPKLVNRAYIDYKQAVGNENRIVGITDVVCGDIHRKDLGVPAYVTATEDMRHVFVQYPSCITHNGVEMYTSPSARLLPCMYDSALVVDNGRLLTFAQV